MTDNGIIIIGLPFETFRFDDKYKWSLAFYKLCTLYHITRQHAYDAFLYLDSDVYIQSSLDNIWQETDRHILMYDINHGLQTENYRIFLKEIANFTGTENGGFITHYGGEFFAANRENAIRFSDECMEIYNKMVEEKFSTTRGDEFIISLAASHMKEKIKNAGAYICRYWTVSPRFVSTNYQFNPVAILHTPSEKKLGLQTLFKYLSRGKELPAKRVHGILGLCPYWSLATAKRAAIRVANKLKGLKC